MNIPVITFLKMSMLVFWVAVSVDLHTETKFPKKHLPPSPHQGENRPDDGGSNRLWNVGQLLGYYMAQYPRRLSPTYGPQRGPKISHFGFYLQDHVVLQQRCAAYLSTRGSHLQAMLSFRPAFGIRDGKDVSIYGCISIDILILVSNNFLNRLRKTMNISVRMSGLWASRIWSRTMTFGYSAS
jgi:hypothetical protein